MTSSYTVNNGLEKPEAGDQEGAWGGTLNTNFDIIDRVLSGVGTISLSGTTHTLTTTDGTLTDGMYRVLLFTGALGANNTVTISPNDQDKLYFIVNNTTDSGSSGPYSIIIKQGTGDTVTVENGRADIVYADGAGSGAAVVSLGTEIGQRAFDLYTYTATAGQTTFTGSDTSSKTLAYSVHNLFVTLNGVTLENGTDYTATNGTSVVLTDAATADDELNIYAFNAFSVANVTAAGGDFSIGDDLSFTSDGAVISFGADNDVTLTHSADQGLILKNANTSDDKPGTLYLQTGETDIAVNDYLGRIFFQAPDEAAGTDAIAIAAEISAISEGDFAADNNATSLSFGTAASGASTQTMKLSSTGVLTLNGSAGALVIPDSGKIGSASAPSTIDINSAGEVGVGTTANTSVTLNVYNNETGHNAINVHQDNSSSTSAVVNILNDGEGYGFYNVNANGSGTYTQSSRGTAGYYRQTGGVASNYGIYAQGDANYGIYGRTLSGSHGGLIAYDDAAACYGILGYSPSTTLYSLYGNGSTYVSGSYTGSDSRLKDIQSRITTSDGILAKVNQLKPTYYKWKANSDQGKADDTEQIGFIAQEVESIFSHVVKQAPVPDLSESPPDADGNVEKRDKTLNEELGDTKFITYEKLTVYLTAALQEASAKIDTLEARIKTLEDASG
jgi:hypothetical protein